MNRVKLIIFYQLLTVFIFSGCSVFYTGGADPIYTKVYLSFSKREIDSVCTLFLTKYPEYKVSNVEIDKLYMKYPQSYSAPYFNQWKVYLDSNVYYPHAPGVMTRFYLYKMPAELLYFVFDIVSINNQQSVLQMRYRKKDSLDSKPINSLQLTREENKLLVEKFENEIVEKISQILGD